MYANQNQFNLCVMAFSITSQRWFLATVLACIFVSSFNSGKAYDDQPHLGAAEVIAKEYLPGVDEGENDEHQPENGIVNTNPVDIVDKALECFNDKNIYSSCEEAYRLSQSGEINVPHEYTDQYCEGPCIAETHLVLDCIEGILKHFRFHNKATVGAVQKTIKTGCSYGPKRGDFKVAEHFEAEEDSAHLATKPVVYGLLLIVMAWHALF